MENLLAQQEKELNDYWKQRALRLALLQRDQSAIIRHCLVLNSRSHQLLKSLLDEQRQAWAQMEIEELGMLLHLHELERENRQQELKRDRIMGLLTNGPGKETGGGDA